jgi:Phosphotransferase enzyme family
VLRGSIRFGDGSEGSLVAKRGASAELLEREEQFYRAVGAPFAPNFLGSAAGVLLLEDVRGRQGDAVAGCSLEEAELVLERVVRFHAAHRGGREGFQRWAREPRSRQERHDAHADAFLERHGADLPAAVVELVDVLRAHLASVIEELAASPPTLIHGDLHLDNVLFDAGERPVVVLDWDHASNGPAAWDVALFLCGSLSADARRAVEDEVLARCAAALGSSLEEFRRECGLALAVQLAGLVTWLSREPREGASRREHAMRESAIRDGRLVAALVDLTEGVVRPRA